MEGFESPRPHSGAPPVAAVAPQEERAMQPSRRALLGAGLGALGLGLGGCAGTPTPAPSASGTAPATPSGPSRLLVVGAPGRPFTRDSARAWDSESFRIIRQVLETLLGVDPDTGAPTPRLAERHEVSADGRVHAFHLVPGLVFDDGEPCDADAVVANIRRWAQAPAPVEGSVPMPSSFVSAFGGHEGEEGSVYAGVEARGAHEVRLRLTSPLRHLAAALSSPAFAISSPASWERTVPVDGVETVTPAGTGPYRWATEAEVAELSRDQPDGADVAYLVPSASHRGEEPAVRPVVVHPWGRATTRLRELRRGTADVIDVVAPGQLRPLVEAGTQVLPRDPLAVLYVGMNLDHPRIRSQYLRQAIAYAVDRPRIAASDVFLEGTRLAHDLVPPALGVGDEEARRYDVNPAQARRLVELSGYDGEELEFLYPAGTSSPSLPEPERVYAMVAQDLGAIGLHITPVPVPADHDYLRAVVSRPTRALHLMGRNGAYRDPHAFLEPFARSWRAETGYRNPRVIQDVDAAASEQDDEARRGLFRRVVRAMALDLPALPLVYPISALATGPRVASYPTSPQLDEPFARVRLTEG